VSIFSFVNSEVQRVGMGSIQGGRGYYAWVKSLSTMLDCNHSTYNVQVNKNYFFWDFREAITPHTHPSPTPRVLPFLWHHMFKWNQTHFSLFTFFFLLKEIYLFSLNIRSLNLFYLFSSNIQSLNLMKLIVCYLDEIICHLSYNNISFCYNIELKKKNHRCLLSLFVTILSYKIFTDVYYLRQRTSWTNKVIFSPQLDFPSLLLYSFQVGQPHDMFFCWWIPCILLINNTCFFSNKYNEIFKFFSLLSRTHLKRN